MQIISNLITLTTAVIALVIVCIIGAAFGWDNKVSQFLEVNEVVEEAPIADALSEESLICRTTGWRCPAETEADD